MERTMQSLALLRNKMARAGISQGELARASGIARPNVSAILGGRQYCSRARAARLMDALHALALEKAQRAAGATADADAQPPAPRVRRLA